MLPSMSLDRQIVTDQHAKSILTTMNNLRKANTLCDITLKVMGESFPAHRIVLAACSDYFCAMFTNEMSEKDKSMIELHEISSDVMRELLDFVYTETVDVSVENVQELLPAACLLQLNGVKEACCSFLENQLDSSNCLGIKIFAEQHSCKALWEAAESYSLHHFEEVVGQEEFKTLPLAEMERLIKSDELQVNSEEPVFQAVIDWVKYDRESRCECLPQLLNYVRLPLLTARYITDVIDQENLVRRSHKCRDLLDEAKKFHLRPDLRLKMVSHKTKHRIGIGDALVVLGGFGSQQNLVNAVEKYDPQTKEWTRLPCLTRRRRYVSAASLEGKLYVIGGFDGQSRLSMAECLDMTEDKNMWTIVSSMNHRRGLAGCCVYKGHIYVCGGFDGYTRHTSMERYNPSNDDWTMLNGMTIGREGAGLVVAGDHIYCIGGYDGINLLDSAERYNPATEEWSTITSMSIQRSGAGVAVLNDVIYVCGGYDGTEHLATVESYDPSTNHWTSLHHMRIPRCYVGACVVRGKLTVVAGYDGNTLLNTVEAYDPMTDTWEILENCMQTPRCDAGIAVVRMP
ncbi:kelch-like protein 12 [Haliotis rufescens]|uniref:kelch-like protein 12 n=1 Tax=Haliotis rufescens TaxID=6454 RepID=UPI00201F5E39|nr:kelch-like protein 12 [Haliotis rufescens]